MREIVLFAFGASIAGTVFLVSLIELVLTVRRRKMNQEIEAKVKELRSYYNDSVNELVIKGDAEIIAATENVEDLNDKLQTQTSSIEQQYQEKIDALTAQSKKELEAAKAKAKKLQQEAKIQADDYLQSRQKEVEQDLMNLVISVTKKVLPSSLSYEVQKELVMDALRDVKSESESAS